MTIAIFQNLPVTFSIFCTLSFTLLLTPSLNPTSFSYFVSLLFIPLSFLVFSLTLLFFVLPIVLSLSSVTTSALSSSLNFFLFLFYLLLSTILLWMSYFSLCLCYTFSVFLSVKVLIIFVSPPPFSSFHFL